MTFAGFPAFFIELLVDERGVEFSAKTAVSIENTAFRLSYAFYM